MDNITNEIDEDNSKVSRAKSVTRKKKSDKSKKYSIAWFF